MADTTPVEVILKLSVRKAIIIGQLIINLPVVIILVGTFAISLLLIHSSFCLLPVIPGFITVWLTNHEPITRGELAQ